MHYLRALGQIGPGCSATPSNPGNGATSLSKNLEQPKSWTWRQTLLVHSYQLKSSVTAMGFPKLRLSMLVLQLGLLEHSGHLESNT